jgi:hypothetical protein
MCGENGGREEGIQNATGKRIICLHIEDAADGMMSLRFN